MILRTPSDPVLSSRASTRVLGLVGLGLLELALSACAELRGSERSTVSTAQTVASAYWFRGTPLSLRPVTQGELVVHTPLATGGALNFTTWYNLQLTNHTGDAVLPDGQGGEMTEIDLALDYVQTFGVVELAFGGIGYTYPEVRLSTKEAYLGASIGALGLDHALTAYYDIDRLDDYYFLYQATRDFALDEHWRAAVAVMLGYMSDGQAQGYFGKKHAGLSDLLLTGSLTYAFDENTSIFCKAAGVTVPDDQLAAALDEAGNDNSGMWFSLGAAWGL